MQLLPNPLTARSGTHPQVWFSYGQDLTPALIWICYTSPARTPQGNPPGEQRCLMSSAARHRHSFRVNDCFEHTTADREYFIGTVCLPASLLLLTVRLWNQDRLDLLIERPDHRHLQQVSTVEFRSGWSKPCWQSCGKMASSRLN
jgi:hypothetical protein